MCLPSLCIPERTLWQSCCRTSDFHSETHLCYLRGMGHLLIVFELSNSDKEPRSMIDSRIVFSYILICISTSWFVFATLIFITIYCFIYLRFLFISFYTICIINLSSYKLQTQKCHCKGREDMCL